ncbi:TetR/AcrR family transcriptional regulator [Mycobacterium sp. 1465703.0]|uniref:TetR/AcrR family transcriptional regulator n=1 Tax=Mycobacterium sp. 1465703.0 TaxID=1834078 RepID=UPI0007FDE76C|nr:TetR/AcrR family transcriptional regulator [Mycobacterium sp. 1465703.0]OBJ10565.1 transcriptional regulator [Mycobacterium sp. 1465703.0]
MAVVTLDGVTACGIARPLRKDAQRNRRRVIEAARELFASQGLEATLNDVAHRAGLGVGTVYRRFPTKEQLVEAIFEDGINQLTELAEAALCHKDSWQGFVWLVEQMCEITATDRGMREIVFTKAHGGERVDAARARLAPTLAKLLERAQDDGYLRPELSPTDMPIFGLLAGTVSEYAGHVDGELWRRYVAILLDGMGRRSGQQRIKANPLDDEQLDAVMKPWDPAGRR